MGIKRIMAGLSGAMLLALAFPLSAAAAATVVVTPSNQQGWTSSTPPADTRPGGAVNFVADSTAPSGAGALQLTTDATTTAKAQYMHVTETPLVDVAELSYFTKQNSATFVNGDPSYQVQVLLAGTTGFTTLVFEPYQNIAQGPVVPGVWQEWDVDAGQFWSSRTATCSGGSVVAGGGGAPFYTLAQLQAMCPEAVVVAYGANVGSNNPGYDVETDLFNFNGTVYDFEPTLSPSSKDDCKKGGWQNFNTPTFKNQGDCVSHVASNGRSSGNNPLSTVVSFFTNLL